MADVTPNRFPVSPRHDLSEINDVVQKLEHIEIEERAVITPN